MKNNTSPGLDGLTVEFYKTFWTCFGEFITNIFNKSYANESLCNSHNEVVLSLIFKKGDANDIKNYRPIALSNTDYKLLAHVLAARMQMVIGNIISYDQTAYIKGRFIGTNIRLVLDLLHYFNHNNKVSDGLSYLML